MRSSTVALLACLTLPAWSAPAWAQDAGDPAGEDPAAEDEGGEQGPKDAKGRKKRRGQRDQDAGAQALQEAADAVLHADEARVLDDGRLELRYTFKGDEQAQDWDLAGFDRAEEGTKRGRGRRRGGEKGQNLALGVSSSQQGLLRHKLSLSGDFEVQFKLRVLRSTTESDLVLGVGKAGARYGTQLVERRSSGFRPVNRGSEVDKAPFAGGRSVTVTLTREGGAFRTQVVGGDARETNALSAEAEGQPLLYATDMHLVLDQVVITAHVDADEVNALAFD